MLSVPIRCKSKHSSYLACASVSALAAIGHVCLLGVVIGSLDIFWLLGYFREGLKWF